VARTAALVWPDARRFCAAALLSCALWLALVATVLAQGLTFPELTGRVVDQAGIIDAPAKSRLEMKLANYDQKTSDQVVVATVPSLQGTSIEDYANRLFRHWKLGQAKTNNGVLLLVAPNERKVRIEVGYGLEGTLTDAVAKMIIQAAIAPKFKAGDFGSGLEAGVDAITATLLGDSEWQDRAKMRPAPESDAYDPLVIFLVFVIIMIVFNMMAARNNRGGGRGGMHRTRDGGWIVFTPSSSSSGWGGGSGGGNWGGGGGFSGGGGSSGGGGASGDW